MRTTAEKVKGVIEVEDEDVVLTPFIEAANSLVTELCAPAGYSADRLEIIETWLAAHFYAIRAPRIASENAGVAISYQGNVGMHLEVTVYGQQVMVLDTAGVFAKLQKQTTKTGKARIKWLG